MKLPCRMCANYTYEEVAFRAFMGCDSDEKRKGFHENNLSYHHTCDNLTLREECKDCNHNKNPYCDSVMAFEDGKCVDRG